jgi:hypothetical protein
MGLTIFHLNVEVNSITKIYEENIFVSTKVQWLSSLTSYIWVASRNLDLDDKVDADPKKKCWICLKYTYVRIWICKFGLHMPILEVGRSSLTC